MITLYTYFSERNRLLRNPNVRVAEKSRQGFWDLAQYQLAELSIVGGVVCIYGLYISLTLNDDLLTAARTLDAITEQGRNELADIMTIRSLLVGAFVFPLVLLFQLFAALSMYTKAGNGVLATFKQILVLNASVGLIPTTLVAMYWNLFDNLTFFNQLLTNGHPALDYTPDQWPPELAAIANAFTSNLFNLFVLVGGAISLVVLAYQTVIEIPLMVFSIQRIRGKGRRMFVFAVNAVLMLFVLPSLLIVCSEGSKVLAILIATSIG